MPWPRSSETFPMSLVCCSPRARSAGPSDLARDVRYPRFGARSAEFGAASAMAVRLADHPRSVLCLYGRKIDAFDAFDRAQAVVFAKLLGLALEVADARADEQQRLANLHEALRTRELIGQAQGILIERERITADEAFNVLRRASQMLNIKVRDIARNLVDTGESPAAAPPVATHAAPPDSTPV